MTFTLATTGPSPEAERERLYDLFESSTVVGVEVHWPPAHQGRVTLAAGIRTDDR